MQLVERYQELVARDPDDISVLWKLLQMLFYLISAITGYVTSYAFFMFQESLHHRCILWAVPSLGRINSINYHDFFLRHSNNGSVQHTEQSNWQERLEVNFVSEVHCSSIMMISLLSCACGIIGFTFFSMCGRGGYQIREYEYIIYHHCLRNKHRPSSRSWPADYAKIFHSNDWRRLPFGLTQAISRNIFHLVDYRRYYESWRLVVPALIVNFCLSLLCLEIACDFDHGFESFRRSLNKLLNQTGVEPVMEYLQSRTKDLHYHHHHVWKYFQITKISAWVGAGAWIFGFVFLILRVVNVTDFRLLKVSIYTTPKTRPHNQQLRRNPNSEAMEI